MIAVHVASRTLFVRWLLTLLLVVNRTPFIKFIAFLAQKQAKFAVNSMSLNHGLILEEHKACITVKSVLWKSIDASFNFRE